MMPNGRFLFLAVFQRCRFTIVAVQSAVLLKIVAVVVTKAVAARLKL